MEWDVGKRSAVEGRVVLVTGAASGIGRASARAIGDRGGRLVLVDRDPRIVAGWPDSDRFLALTGDVTDPAGLESAVQRAIERFGRIDAVFANAGIAPTAPTTVLATGDDAYEQVIAVNLTGVWNTVRAVLPHIVASQGYVLLSGSIYSFLNGVVNAPYAMSKAAVESLGRTLRVELAPHGATAGVLYPGWVDTPLVAPAFGSAPLVTELRRSGYPGPFGELVTPEQVAGAVVRAIERRATRTVVPRRWLPVLWGRGLADPVIDWSLAVRPGFRRQLRRIEASSSSLR